MSHDMSVARHEGATTSDGKGLAIAAVVLGVADLVLMAVLFAAAANSGGSFYFTVG